MLTKYGTKIIFIVAKTRDDFTYYLNHRKDLIPPPMFSSGVAYNKTENYRYVEDVRTLRGFRQAEVVFLPGSEQRDDYLELSVEAMRVRQK